MEEIDSTDLFEQSKQVIPGGVNSPVRSFSYVGGTPPFMKSGCGSTITDVSGKPYIDYVMSWGPLILGHAHPSVIEAVNTQARLGLSYGAPTDLELELATLITDAFPSIDQVRLVNSGTEACMSALRLARAYTNRPKVLKFDGCYHGHSDGLLAQSGSGAALLSEPTSAGVTEQQVNDTLIAEYNSLESVREQFQSEGDSIAAVIVEPVAGNMGLVLPEDGFLEGLASLAKQNGSLLIFDEVITGFRTRYGGYQETVGIHPDITCLGKIIGGGMPVGAYGGRRDIMEYVAPLGPMYQAGTLSGNPIATAAGIATLKELQNPNIYEDLRKKTNLLCDGLEEVVTKSDIGMSITRLDSMWYAHFNKKPVKKYGDLDELDTESHRAFYHKMLDKGVYLAPSPFEISFLSTAHTEEDILNTVEAVSQSF